MDYKLKNIISRHYLTSKLNDKLEIKIALEINYENNIYSILPNPHVSKGQSFIFLEGRNTEYWKAILLLMIEANKIASEKLNEYNLQKNK